MMWEKIGEETFMAATFLPCEHKWSNSNALTNRLKVVIKHPNYPGVNYLYIDEVLNTKMKNQAAGKGKVYYKQIKKVSRTRQFHRGGSVFKEFIEDSK